jgi:tRNA (guanine37-N1)-methyltransferase
MTFTVLTLFPELLAPFVATSIIGRAVDRGLIDIETVDIRDYADDPHNTCDDSPYGGGAGMVLKAEPVSHAIESVLRRRSSRPRTVYLTAGGAPFDRHLARRWAAEGRELLLIAGRYEGVDQRVVDMFVDDEVSIGDYVLIGGEVAAMAVMEAVARLVPGVIQAASLEEESFEGDVLEYPQYTRPAVFRGVPVPPVLLSGDHARIREWRRRQATERTARLRPDLLRRSEGCSN